MKIFIRYNGIMIPCPQNEKAEDVRKNYLNAHQNPLTLAERAQLINARFECKKMKDGREEIQVVVNI